MISLLFRERHSVLQSPLNRKGHHKLSLTPCHLPPSPAALEEKSPYCWRDKGEGTRWFRRSAMNRPDLEGLDRFWGSLFKAESAGRSHLQHNGLHTAPEARLPFASHPGGWMEIPQPPLASSPPTPSER